MTFKPKRDDHSIIEVVFGITMSRPFSPEEIERVVARHDEWREWLPRFNRQAGLTFSLGAIAVGGIPQQIAFPATGATFDRMQPDGSLQWRLKVENNTIFVNCLDYSRWSDVWARVKVLLARILELTSAEDLSITAIVLQYIDLFEWEGAVEAYRADELLRAGDIIPARGIGQGPWWHLHQGWYRVDDRLPPSRLLERINIDSTIDGDGLPTVKFDSYLAFDLPEPVPSAGAPLVEGGDLDAWFSVLHDLDKELLRSSLTADLAERIKLNG